MAQNPHQITSEPDASTKQQASELCQSCGLCCIGVVTPLVYLCIEADKEFIEYHEDTIIIRSRGSSPYFDLPCIVYDGSCSQYEIRPRDCRDFQCGLLKRFYSHEISFAQASDVIQSTRKALRNACDQYEKQQGVSLEYNEIYRELKKIQSSITDEESQRKFSRNYPDYLLVRILVDRHF